MQLVTQRRHRRGIEHPRLEVVDALLGRLVDRAWSRTTGRARAHLAGAANELVAAQLVERRVHAGRREPRRAKALIEPLGELIPIPGTLDHEPQYRVLRRHSRPSWSTGVNPKGTRIDACLHSNQAMNQTRWNLCSSRRRVPIRTL